MLMNFKFNYDSEESILGVVNKLFNVIKVINEWLKNWSLLSGTAICIALFTEETRKIHRKWFRKTYKEMNRSVMKVKIRYRSRDPNLDSEGTITVRIYKI
jgi:hypothetical protein